MKVYIFQSVKGFGKGETITSTIKKAGGKKAEKSGKKPEENKPTTRVLKAISDDAVNYKTAEDFVKAYDVTNYKGKWWNEKSPTHALVDFKKLYPGEWDNWLQVETMEGSGKKIDGYAKNWDINKMNPILVRKYPESDGFAVEDGHHRMAAMIKASLMNGKPFGQNGKVPVYFDRDTLTKIWKIQNGKAPEKETYNILKDEIQSGEIEFLPFPGLEDVSIDMFNWFGSNGAKLLA
jgi:hypothetical protein